MIDCHCHLADKEFDQDLDDVIGRAKEAGVRACVVVPEHFGEFEKVLDLVKRYPGFIIPCAGVHPVQYDTVHGQLRARSVRLSDMENVEDWIEKNHSNLVAIGEVGLDYTPRYIRSSDDRQTQEGIFARQIEIAKRFDLSLNCHSRSAGKHVIDCLVKNGATKVLLHAFSGNYKSATPGIEAGYFFSVPPSSALAQQKISLFEKIPLDRLILETDSPVLGPQKDARNEPANLRISAEFIAKLKNIDVDTVIKQTTQNALKVFPKIAQYVKL